MPDAPQNYLCRITHNARHHGNSLLLWCILYGQNWNCIRKKKNESANCGCETEKQTFRNRALCQKTTPCLGGKRAQHCSFRKGFWECSITSKKMSDWRVVGRKSNVNPKSKLRIRWLFLVFLDFKNNSATLMFQAKTSPCSYVQIFDDTVKVILIWNSENQDCHTDSDILNSLCEPDRVHDPSWHF